MERYLKQLSIEKNKKRNKRQYKKIISNIHFEIYNDLFEKLKLNGIETVNKKYLSHYFIFSKEPKSVCHFQIKNFPDWVFGIWITKGVKDFQVSYFGEHLHFLNKFKPTATSISHVFVNNFLTEVQMVQNREEFVVGCISNYVDPLVFDGNSESIEKDGKETLKEFQLDKEEERKGELQKWKKFWEALKEMKKREPIKNIYIQDFQNVLKVAGYSPRFDGVLELMGDVSDEELDKIFERLDRQPKEVEELGITFIKAFDEGIVDKKYLRKNKYYRKI